MSDGNRLAEMASRGEVSYEPTGESRRADGRVWWEMTATSADGRKWTYWLRRDAGSYAGSASVGGA